MCTFPLLVAEEYFQIKSVQDKYFELQRVSNFYPFTYILLPVSSHGLFLIIEPGYH